MTVMLIFSCKENAEIFQEDESTEDVEEFAFFDPDNPLNVSSCDAEDVACVFMQSDRGENNQKASNILYSTQEITVIPDENMEPAMYVINLDPDGFCIVSATKQIDPILAYCDEGTFDLENISPGLVTWLYEEMEKIQYVRNDTSYVAPEMVASVWHKYTSINDKRRYASPNKVIQQVGLSNGPLLKTKWGQDYPYNYYAQEACPELKVTRYLGKYPIGCVATATAQVLKYYSYPANKYKWEKMKDTYSVLSMMDDGAYDMAKMFIDIATWLKMKYDCKGSGAYTSDIPNILKTKFNYASGGTYQYLSIEDAKPLVSSEILAGRPVIMDGYNYHTTKTTGKLWWKKVKDLYDGGHCWVCDGYKQLIYTTVIRLGTNSTEKYSVQYFYHMNWGWGGAGMEENYDNNGWFSFSDIEIDDPYIRDEKGEKFNFQYKRGYLTGIKAK
ncbi:MAG: C10 family peptidase [Salinivirgaceae bacterium]|nr:C10 family peptidase [Salinivirgaceae bacterium]